MNILGCVNDGWVIEYDDCPNMAYFLC